MLTHDGAMRCGRTHEFSRCPLTDWERATAPCKGDLIKCNNPRYRRAGQTSGVFAVCWGDELETVTMLPRRCSVHSRHAMRWQGNEAPVCRRGRPR